MTGWSGPSRVTGNGEAKPHRKAFPGGRQVQGKTLAGRSECGSDRTGHLTAPAYQTVDLCLRQAARELASIYLLSEWCSRASGLPRRQIAMMSASVTSAAVISAFIDQPTTRRENRSITAAT